LRPFQTRSGLFSFARRPACYRVSVPLSWNEIRHRAIAFSKEWRGETRETTKRQSPWIELWDKDCVHYS
jgi:hypothetical protein